VSSREKRSDRNDEGAEPQRHPSYDPSGDEPAGSSTGVPGRSFADAEIAEAEAEQARGRRESMRSRDNTLGPHDQESGHRSGRREGPGEGIHTDDPH
jgi:hypothetical protein